MSEGSESNVVWTPLKILQWAVPYLKEKGVQNPRLDAEILLAHFLQIDRLKVYLQFDQPLDDSELSLLRVGFKRRASREPLQMILGKCEFFGLPFKVTPSVLIPRPETEQIVEQAVSLLREIPLELRTVLDLGTGSGCIAVSIAKTIPCKVWAVDISQKALEIAEENGVMNDVKESIRWRHGDWFEALQTGDPEQFRVILSNPPYIGYAEKNDLAPEIREYEPPEALFSEEGGLLSYRVLSEKIVEKVVPGGSVLLEMHADRCLEIYSIFEKNGWAEMVVMNDLQGHPRVLKLKNKY